MKRTIMLLAAFAAIILATAANPTATKYTPAQCEGSGMPYPEVCRTPAPDSLRAVMINHVGRHGARFLSSGRFTATMLRALAKADSLGTITREGKEFRTLCNQIVNCTAGRWGALDSLGMAEQRAIASRLFATFPDVVKGSRINAISSYSPRCIMSMDEFTHQLSRLDNHLEIYTSSGRQNSPLVRPFDTDEAYKEFMASDTWREAYQKFFDTEVTAAPAMRLLGKDYPFEGDEAADLTMTIYKIISGCSAMSVKAPWEKFLTIEEYNALWAVSNLHHYLTHSASTLSTAAPDMASALLADLIRTTDSFIAGENTSRIMLRFGHAETMMPLLALMHVAGCYYMTNYFDTVGLHWRDFHVVPMASNLQLILFTDAKGEYYVRMDLNEVPVPIIPGRTALYTRWSEARDYFNKCLPLIDQLF